MSEQWPPWQASMRRPRRTGLWTVISWNVAGLRGLLKRRPQAIAELVAQQQPDVLCLQETKLQQAHVEQVSAQLALADYGSHWCCATERLGYAGVATFWRTPPAASKSGLKSIGALANGRVITSRFAQLSLVNVYVPNSGEGLKNLTFRTQTWDPALARHLRRQGPDVLLVGDLNVAPCPVDVYDPVRLARLQVPGFTQQERDSFVTHLTQQGLVDAFRAQHPRVRAYTFFSYRAQMRAKGKGWRLDHCLPSQRLLSAVYDCFILETVAGSDHVPIGLSLDLAKLGASAN